jgi:hypothetical protein
MSTTNKRAWVFGGKSGRAGSVADGGADGGADDEGGDDEGGEDEDAVGACSKTRSARPGTVDDMVGSCLDWSLGDKSRQTRRVSAPRLLLALLVTSSAHAGQRWDAFDPLVPPVGLGVVAVEASGFASRFAFDDDGLATASTSTQAVAVEAQAQLGIGEGLALTLALPWRQLSRVGDDSNRDGNRDGSGGSAAGFADARVGLRLVGLTLDAPRPASSSAPPSMAASAAQLATGTQAGIALEAKLPLTGRAPSVAPSAVRVSDGQVDLTIAGELGARLPLGGTLFLRTGYRLRTDGLSDAVVGTGAFSIDLLDGRIAPAATVDFVWSLDPARGRRGEALEETGAGAASVGGACRLRLPEFDPGLALDVGAALSSRGRNTLTGLTLTVGASYAF